MCVTTSMNDLPWIAGIRAFEDEIPNDSTFLDVWRAALRDWAVTLRDDGRIIGRGDTLLGEWALLDADAATNAVLDVCDRGCPFVGPRLGALAFQLYSWCDPSARQDFVCGLIKEGRDGIVHRPSGESWPAVTLQARSLYGCVGKAALDDGAFLLTRVPGVYSEWTTQAVSTGLLALGDSAGSWSAYWMSTCHNPLRLVFESDRERRHLDDFPLTLQIPDVAVDLWLFDFDNLEELMDDVEDSPRWQ